MDLYSLLGVARGATYDAIRSAFRRRVKTVHPDVGGDPVEFSKLMLAHDVLADEERRKTYDATGRTEPPQREDYVRGVALGLLGQLLQLILTADVDGNPNQENLVALGVEHLNKSIGKHELQLKAIDKAMARARSMKGRWRPLGSAEDDNVLEGLLKSQEAHLTQSRANVVGQIQALRLAIEILKEHRFVYDARTGTVTTTATFYQATAR